MKAEETLFSIYEDVEITIVQDDHMSGVSLAVWYMPFLRPLWSKVESRMLHTAIMVNDDNNGMEVGESGTPVARGNYENVINRVLMTRSDSIFPFSYSPTGTAATADILKTNYFITRFRLPGSSASKRMLRDQDLVALGITVG